MQSLVVFFLVGYTSNSCQSIRGVIHSFTYGLPSSIPLKSWVNKEGQTPFFCYPQYSCG